MLNNIEVYTLCQVVDKFGYTMIHQCAYFNQLGMLELLL